jgi:hypothetical protein
MRIGQIHHEISSIGRHEGSDMQAANASGIGMAPKCGYMHSLSLFQKEAQPACGESYSFGPGIFAPN